MATQTSGAGSPRRAITDLYDEARGTFLIQYPILLVLLLSLTGVAAFALTGFLGYSYPNQHPDTGVALDFFQQAWLLFLWLCALVITLQISIFRDKSLRARLIAVLVISLVAVGFIGVTFFNNSLPDILKNLLQGHRLLMFLAGNQLTYTIVNFGLLAIFWVDTIRRWIRGARGESLSPSVDIGLDDQPRDAKQDQPSLQELVSGDLIAGALLALALAGLFWVQFLPNFIHPQGVTVTGCTLSWPIGGCAGAGGGPADAPTLTFLDLLQTLIYLPLGLLLLALSATVAGFGAVGGVEDRQEEAAALSAQAAPATAERGGAMPVAEDVAATVLNTLRSALSRRLRLLAANLALSLRSVAWPGLIVVAIYGLAQFATDIQGYLHSDKHFSDITHFVLPAAGWGLASALGVVISAALFLFRWRVAENTLRFLGLIGLIVLLTIWIFSLALWGFNQLLLLTHALAIPRHPFDPPSSLTAISLGALVIFGVSLLFRRGGGGQAPASGGQGNARGTNG